MQVSANLHYFRFRLPVLHIQNLSNHCWHKYDPTISRIFWISFWRVFSIWSNCSGEGSTETNSPESSDFDDLNDQTCPFCETDCVHYIETDEDQAGGPLLYCSKGSLCSRRSKATLKSRKVPGKRKKLPLPPKHQLQQPPQRHPTVSAFIYEAPNVVRTKSSFRDMHRDRVVRKGYCFCVTL